jgi:hypothetical protein
MGPPVGLPVVCCPSIAPVPTRRSVVSTAVEIAVVRSYRVTVEVALHQTEPNSDDYSYRPRLSLDRGNKSLGMVEVEVASDAATRLSTAAGSESGVQIGILRYAMAHVDDFIRQAGLVDTEAGQITNQLFRVEWADSETIIDRYLRKSCRYQIEDHGDLLCSAAAASDPTIVGSSGRRNLAPTSRSLCGGCAMPSADLVCSHLMHPEVTALGVAEGGNEMRHLANALCDLGHAEVQSPGGCQAGGHSCWRRLIDDRPPVIVSEPPLVALPEALDFLDAIWRLTFGKDHRLLRLSTVTEPAGLVRSAHSADELDARLSDLADVLDRLVVEESLVSRAKDGEIVKGSLNRVRSALSNKLAPDEVGDAVAACGVLQKVRGLRHMGQHSGMASDFPRLLREIGIADRRPDFQAVWSDVSRVAANAVMTIVRELRRSERPDP